MNVLCEVAWIKKTSYKDAFRFGVEAYWLADLVLKGEKLATTLGYVLY